MLFTEEELTRNLQIVLRTFDDLNYRQEQRFHLELGLLKLIHAQRLLPIEELLSGVSAARPAIQHSGTAPATRPAASPARPAAPAATSPLSPFGATSGRLSSETTMESSSKQDSASSPFPAATATATVYATTITEGALAVAPQAAVAEASLPSVEQIRHAVVNALAEGSHVSASQLLDAGKWTIDGASLRIEVAGMGKKMIALTVNAAAEKIIRQELQRLGAPTRLLVVPLEGTAHATSMSAPPAGSIQEVALAHPLVQRAREIFKAEVRSVVDLRQK